VLDRSLLMGDPDNAMAHQGIGGAYLESGKYKEAIESFKQAIRINPDYAEAHYFYCFYTLTIIPYRNNYRIIISHKYIPSFDGCFS